MPDRIAFADAVERALTGLARRQGLIAVLFCDLDRFKAVNDGLGHAVGDQLLNAAAGRIRRAVRPGDVVSRAGGDEFTVLLDPVESLGQARQLAEGLLASLSALFAVDHRLVWVTASIGVAVAESPLDTAADLTIEADAALRQAKALGRNRVAVFDTQLRRALKGRADQRAALQAAIGGGGIEVHYQPQVDLFTGAMVGAEAFVRWRHPALGVLAAADFVPLAYEAGLIDALDSLVLTEAVALTGRWRRPPSGRRATVSVNRSAAWLMVADPAEELAGLFDRLDVKPSNVCIELPEAAFDRDAMHGGRTNGLRELGVHLAIDQFGTPGSTLALLRGTPADTVKLHRDLIADLGRDPTAAALVHGIATAAADLGLTIVATGVETEQQAELLRDSGCHLAQGWLYSPPRPSPILIDSNPQTARASSGA